MIYLQLIVWPKALKALEGRNTNSDAVSVHELAKAEYEDWLRNVGSGDMESRPTNTKFKFTKEAKKAYAFVMAQVSFSVYWQSAKAQNIVVRQTSTSLKTGNKLIWRIKRLVFPVLPTLTLKKWLGLQTDLNLSDTFVRI